MLKNRVLLVAGDLVNRTRGKLGPRSWRIWAQFEELVKMGEQLYKFCWGNNSKRQTMKGRICRVICRAKKMNSCGIQFIDNGQLECVSRNSLRKVKGYETKIHYRLGKIYG
jgi:hypothetical protein